MGIMINKSNRHYAIVDLDGTLSNDFWRINKIPKSGKRDEHFEDYNKCAALDVPFHPIACLVTGLKVFYKADIIIFTARPIKFQSETLQWLDQIGLADSLLYMRDPDNEGLPSADLKRKWFNHLTTIYGYDEDNCICILDDKEEVIRAFNQINQNTIKVKINK